MASTPALPGPYPRSAYLPVRLGHGEPDTWCSRPVVMPSGWDGIEVERIWVRGREARLVAEHGADHAVIT